MPGPIPVAVVTNSLTPYRLALHRRLNRELPEIAVHSVFTHEQSNAPWQGQPPDDIRPVRFGQGEPSAGQDRVRNVGREWAKGGRILRWLRDTGVKAVVLGGYNDPGRLRILRACRGSGIVCLLCGDSNIRGERPHTLKGRLKRLLLPRVLRRCDGALPCGSLGADYFAHYGVPRDRIWLFPYEPDYELVRSISPAEVAAANASHGLPVGRRRIVYSGRFIDVKRVDLLIDAFVGIADERPEWDLLLVGQGPLQADLRRRVPEPLTNRVRWVPFLDDQRALSALYRGSDVLAIPSDFEPWGVVVNEAAAAGLAIVASDAVGAAAELVQAGVNGATFPAGDGAAMTRALREVTAAERVDALKAGAAVALAYWQRRGDPVAGLRAALRVTGVLT